MPNFSIVLPESYGVVSRDTGVTVDVTKLSPEIIARLALHGLSQKIGDSAAGALDAAGFKGLKFKDLNDDQKAKVTEHAKASMVDTVEALVKGEWTERTAAESVDPIVARIRVLFGAMLREDAKDVYAKSIKPLEGAERGKALDELFAGQDDDFRTAMTAEAKKQLADEAKAKERTKKLTIKIAV
jgi:hypothetical protein